MNRQPFIHFLFILGITLSGLSLFSSSSNAQFGDSWEFLNAVRELDFKEMRSRLGSGANINRLDKDGIPAMMIGADKRNVELINFLLEMGAKVDVVTSPRKETALMRLSSTGGNELITILLKAGADINLGDANGETPLMKASRSRKTRTVKLLLENGADVNISDYTGRTALDIARDTRSGRLIRVLEAAGAN
jgi:ankyrin repeat protein